MSIVRRLNTLRIEPAAHPPHYMLHKYWGRKPHNLVSSYIKLCTQPGDTVLDPFMGSGGVVIESNKLRRIGYGIDLNPMAYKITVETLKPSPDTQKLQRTFEKIIEHIPPDILQLATTMDDKGEKYILSNAIWQDDEIKRVKYYKDGQRVIRDANQYDIKQLALAKKLLKRYTDKGLVYPQHAIMQYVRRNGKKHIHELFSERNLLIAAYIIQQIKELKDQDIKQSLLFMFTSALPNFSKMIPGDLEGVVGKSGWQISKFWTPSIHTEKNVIDSLRLKLRKYIVGKQHIKPLLTKTNYYIFNESCESMKNIKSKSIDYIFTDPPYGDSISYFALSSFWSTWLEDDVAYDGEIIYDPCRGKKEQDYSLRLSRAFKEMHRVLKDNNYMSFTFHNRHMKFWKIVIEACTSAGFQIVHVKWVDQAVASGTQGINHKNTLKGDFVYTFQKSKIPTKNWPKKNGEQLIVAMADKMIREKGYAATAALYEQLIPALVRKKAFYDSQNKILNIDRIISNKFRYALVEGNNYGWIL